MIQIASEQNTSEIIDLVSRIFPNHVLLSGGESLLKEQIRKRQYLSFVAQIQNKIVGQGGILINGSIDFLGGLVVYPEFRGDSSI